MRDKFFIILFIAATFSYATEPELKECLESVERFRSMRQDRLTAQKMKAELESKIGQLLVKRGQETGPEKDKLSGAIELLSKQAMLLKGQIFSSTLTYGPKRRKITNCLNHHIENIESSNLSARDVLVLFKELSSTTKELKE